MSEFDYPEKIDLNEAAKNLKRYFDTIASKFDNYEERTSQKSMIRAIVKAYKMGEHAIIEAPTGTGKSLAYLLAFLSVWEQFETKIEDDVMVEKKPVLCIATNTIALQEQLMSKDIPAFRDLIGVDFKTALIKGRNNFICNRNVKKILKEDNGSFTSLTEAEAFSNLMKEIHPKDELLVGDRSKINTQIEPSLWEKVSTDSNGCSRKECPFYKECFFYQEKAENAQADVLITNHAMMFADLSVRIESDFEQEGLVLPAYDFLVFDEAHNLEDVASNFLGSSVSRLRVKKLLSEMTTHFTKGSISTYMKENDENESRMEMESLIIQLDTINEEFFKKVVEFVDDNTVQRVHQMPQSIKSFEQDMSVLFKELEKGLTRCEKELEGLKEEDKQSLKSMKARLHTISNELGSFLNQEKPNMVYWIDAPKKGKTSESRHFFASVCQTPISVNEVLHDNLFDRMDSVVLTSATLGTDNLDYIANRLGIPRYVGAMFHSPFDYEEQSRVYVPQKALNPKHPDYFRYMESEIKELIEASKGRTLVLFTSYSQMNSMSLICKDYVEGLGYRFLKQGDLPRTPLINAFRDDRDSVLFATSSYWEGIDVQGDSLSSVIITRLPFEVPDQPVIQARMERMQERGQNPFMEYQVPAAVMKFKQGFGRLIRSTSDKGVVTVLDSRIVSMHYGKKFLQALPPVPLVRDIEEVKKLF